MHILMTSHTLTNQRFQPFLPLYGCLLPDGCLPRRIYEGRLGSVVAIDIRSPPRPRAPWMQETAQLSNSG